jgi:hypothetical protein
MARRLSFFGAPRKDFHAGGAHIAVFVVPVFEGRLVAFDVQAPGVEGRFLPWTVLAFGGNPYADASLLMDDWCQGALASLRLVDVIGERRAEGSHELAIVFRAELTAAPAGDAHRTPVHLSPEDLESINDFAPADLQRWVEAGEQPQPGPPIPPPADKDDGPKLVF